MTARPSPAPVDTIVALATPAGPGERAIVRLSGPQAAGLVRQVLDVVRLPPPGRLGTGRLDLGGGAGLSLELLHFVAPHSFTGEHLVELQLPGWPVVVAELQRRLIEAGARPAARGEFTRRALACGRLTLEQALAVGRLGAALDLDEVTAAAGALAGHTARLGARMRAALLDALALIEAHCDFEQEETGSVTPEQWRAALRTARELADRLVRAGRVTPLVDGETDVVLLGAPNAGKSSLLLALAPGARTSVSPVPGTTRDMLEARVERGGRRWRLLDGPGIDPRAPGLGPLDRRAMDLFLDSLPDGALVLHLVDLSTAAPTPAGSDARSEAAEDGGRHEGADHRADDRAGDGESDGEGEGDGGLARRLAAIGERPTLAVGTKLDLWAGSEPPPVPLAVSALTGAGLSELWEALGERAPVPSMPVVAQRGEWEAAARILPALRAALEGDPEAELPLLAISLREALERLEQEAEQPLQLTEAVLDRIFSRFCIGK